ncbi:helix-turn-helix transcriptional regulator [Lysinibacillus fusiformis]|nr:helix-turn-helix transcriptional regulator [Lysinibacillus fusiformis]
MNDIVIGRQIKNIRKENNLTAVQFAKKINMSQPTLSRIENGSQEITFSQLETICNEFNIAMSDFFRKIEDKNEQHKIDFNGEAFPNNDTLEYELLRMIATLSNDQKKALYVFLLPFIEL